MPNDLIDLSGRTALVTGGSRGIGRAVALLLARAGARVGIGYRADREAAERTVRDLVEAAGDGADGHPAWARGADLAAERGVNFLFEGVDEAFGGPLDIFVANAGIWNEEARPVLELDPAEWRRMMDANLTSAYLTTRAALRRMGEGGRVVLITSTAAQRGEAGHAHYAASKGALQSFVKSVAVEVAPLGITVNAVAPGWVDTDMSAGTLRGEYRETVVSGIPVGRIASAGDVAGPVVFLASELARHVTGEVLNVNGGGVLCG